MLTTSVAQRMSKKLAFELAKLSHRNQRGALRKLGGKTFSKQKALIQALYLRENQIDFFSQAADDTHGARLMALDRKWELFKLNAKGAARFSDTAIETLASMFEVNVANNLTSIENTLRALTKMRDRVRVFAGMKRRKAA